jgi:hypothetical protein
MDVPQLTGTPNQIELAEQIRERAGAEFDRVIQALRAARSKQAESDRASTQAVIVLVGKKRADVMAHEGAGYFIHEWQNLDGRVRQLLSMDAEYQKIQSARRQTREEKCQ